MDGFSAAGVGGACCCVVELVGATTTRCDWLVEDVWVPVYGPSRPCTPGVRGNVIPVFGS